MGIIGCGQVSHFMALAAKLNRHIKITHCMDPNLSRARLFSRLYGIPKYYESEEEFYSDSHLPEAVYIATPHFLHGKQIVKALEKGTHVLCEKPPVTDREDANSVLKTLYHSSAKVGINFQFRFDKNIFKLREMLSAGLLGEIYNITLKSLFYRKASYFGTESWHGQPEKSGGGVLSAHGSHLINLAFWLLNERPVKAWGCSHLAPYPNSLIESSGLAMLELESGLCMQLYSTAHQRHSKPIQVKIEGEKGFCSYQGFTASSLKHNLTTNIPIYKAPKWGPQSFMRSLEAFRLWLKGEEDYPSDFKSSLSTFASLEAIYLSSKSGKPEAINHQFFTEDIS